MADNLHVMKCGHRANGSSDGKECCVNCAIDANPNAFVRATEVPDLNGRKARCIYGGHGECESSFSLAFFDHRPQEKCDKYYCGCYGWD